MGKGNKDRMRGKLHINQGDARFSCTNKLPDLSDLHMKMYLAYIENSFPSSALGSQYAFMLRFQYLNT